MADKPPPRRGAVIGCLRITILSERVVPRRQAGRTRWKQCDSRPVFPRYGKTEAGSGCGRRRVRQRAADVAAVRLPVRNWTIAFVTAAGCSNGER